MQLLEARPNNLVLDYAAVPESIWVRCWRPIRAAGPWVVWPSRASWTWLAALVLAAVWLSWLPRNYQVVAEFETGGNGDWPTQVPGTNRVFYRASDHSLWIRDFGSGDGGAARVQLEPSATHTEPVVSADGSRVVGLASTDLAFWDARTGDMLGRMSLAKLQHDGEMPNDWSEIALAPDGKRLAAVYAKGQLVVWDISTARAARRIAARGPDPGMSAARAEFSSDGRHLLVTSARSVWLGDARTLEERTRFLGQSYGDVQATWSQTGPQLIVSSPPSVIAAVPGYLHAERTWLPNETWRALTVIDPADPTWPLVRVAYWSSYHHPAVLARDGRTLTVAGEGVYDLRSGRRTEWPAGAVLDVIPPDGGAGIVRLWYTNFSSILDGRSGRVIARMPSSYHAFVLADGRTVVAYDPDGRVRARRLDPLRRAEPSAWSSWRLWIMALPAALLARGLSRDAQRRSRLRPGRFDSLAARSMIAAGVAALTAGLASTAVQRGFMADVWWGGHWAGACFIALVACAMGVLAGSRVWLWTTRVLLVGFAGLAGFNALRYYGAVPPYEWLDLIWTPPIWLLRVACAACALAAAVIAVRIGRAVRLA